MNGYVITRNFHKILILTVIIYYCGVITSTTHETRTSQAKSVFDPSDLNVEEVTLMHFFEQIAEKREIIKYILSTNKSFKTTANPKHPQKSFKYPLGDVELAEIIKSITTATGNTFHNWLNSYYKTLNDTYFWVKTKLTTVLNDTSPGQDTDTRKSWTNDYFIKSIYFALRQRFPTVTNESYMAYMTNKSKTGTDAEIGASILIPKNDFPGFADTLLSALLKGTLLPLPFLPLGKINYNKRDGSNQELPK